MLSKLLPTFLFCCLAFSVNAEQEKNEAYLKKLRTDINELQAYLKQAQDDHKVLVDSLRKSDEEVAKISQQVDRLRQSLKEERARLKKLQGEQKTLRHQQSQQQLTLNDIIRATHRMGQQPQLQVMLNQENPGEMARNMAYLGYLSKAHQNQISDYRATLVKLSTIETDLKQQQSKLEAELKAFKAEQTKLRKKRDQQKETAQKLKTTIASSGQSLERKKQDRQQLIDLLGRVEEVFLSYERDKESRPFSKLRGKLPSPINRNARKLFGRRLENQKQKWQGWLYPTSEGSNVRAVHHGRVVFSDWLRGYGLLTILDHGQGYMTLYARNQALLRSPGEWVETGDIIARVGRSGGYEEDALYFEIRKKGQPQNPRRWLARK